MHVLVSSRIKKIRSKMKALECSECSADNAAPDDDDDVSH